MLPLCPKWPPWASPRSSPRTCGAFKPLLAVCRVRWCQTPTRRLCVQWRGCGARCTASTRSCGGTACGPSRWSGPATRRVYCIPKWVKTPEQNTTNATVAMTVPAVVYSKTRLQHDSAALGATHNPEVAGSSPAPASERNAAKRGDPGVNEQRWCGDASAFCVLTPVLAKV